MIVQTESNQNGKAIQVTTEKHSKLAWKWFPVDACSLKRTDCRGAANYQRS
jgi:hypothetical protein